MEAVATFHAIVGDVEYPMLIGRGRDAGLLGVHCAPEHAAAPAELFGGDDSTFQRAERIEAGHEA